MYFIFNILLLLEFITLKSIILTFLSFMFFMTLNDYLSFNNYTEEELKNTDEDIKKIGKKRFYILYIIDLLENFIFNCGFTLIIILVLYFTGALK